MLIQALSLSPLRYNFNISYLSFSKFQTFLQKISKIYFKYTIGSQICYLGVPYVGSFLNVENQYQCKKCLIFASFMASGCASGSVLAMRIRIQESQMTKSLRILADPDSYPKHCLLYFWSAASIRFDRTAWIPW